MSSYFPCPWVIKRDTVANGASVVDPTDIRIAGFGNNVVFASKSSFIRIAGGGTSGQPVLIVLLDGNLDMPVSDDPPNLVISGLSIPHVSTAQGNMAGGLDLRPYFLNFANNLNGTYDATSLSIPTAISRYVLNDFLSAIPLVSSLAFGLTPG